MGILNRVFGGSSESDTPGADCVLCGKPIKGESEAGSFKCTSCGFSGDIHMHCAPGSESAASCPRCRSAFLPDGGAGEG